MPSLPTSPLHKLTSCATLRVERSGDVKLDLTSATVASFERRAECGCQPREVRVLARFTARRKEARFCSQGCCDWFAGSAGSERGSTPRVVASREAGAPGLQTRSRGSIPRRGLGSTGREPSRADPPSACEADALRARASDRRARSRSGSKASGSPRRYGCPSGDGSRRRKASCQAVPARESQQEPATRSLTTQDCVGGSAVGRCVETL
jgi:hypothetical protein